MTKRQEFTETTWYTGLGCWVLGLGLVLVAVLVFLYYAYAQGWIFSQENKNIRHSVGYTLAANQRCHSDMIDFSSVPASDTTHRRALVLDCESALNGVSSSDVDSTVSEWLATNGGTQ
jgi:hypothetical protein